jgi:hypothetical protein
MLQEMWLWLGKGRGSVRLEVEGGRESAGSGRSGRQAGARGGRPWRVACVASSPHLIEVVGHVLAGCAAGGGGGLALIGQVGQPCEGRGRQAHGVRVRATGLACRNRDPWVDRWAARGMQGRGRERRPPRRRQCVLQSACRWGPLHASASAAPSKAVLCPFYLHLSPVGTPFPFVLGRGEGRKARLPASCHSSKT